MNTPTVKMSYPEWSELLSDAYSDPAVSDVLESIKKAISTQKIRVILYNDDSTRFLLTWNEEKMCFDCVQIESD